MSNSALTGLAATGSCDEATGSEWGAKPAQRVEETTASSAMESFMGGVESGAGAWDSSDWRLGEGGLLVRSRATESAKGRDRPGFSNWAPQRAYSYTSETCAARADEVPPLSYSSMAFRKAGRWAGS